jgi:hypothetical protein
MNSKSCNRCGETKPLTEFYRQRRPSEYRTAKSALSCEPTLYYSCCKPCAIKKTLAYRELQRQVRAKLTANKPAYSCSRCGRTDSTKFTSVNHSTCTSCLHSRSSFIAASRSLPFTTPL